MDFQILDSFYYMKDDEVKKKYEELFDKHIFRGGDSDHYLIIILDKFNDKPNLFSDNEVKLLSSLIDIRKNGGYVTFKGIYDILKKLITSLGTCLREDNVNNIFSLLSNNSISIKNSKCIKDNFDVSSPSLKYIRSFQSLSPTFGCGELSTSYKPEVIFGWMDEENFN